MLGTSLIIAIILVADLWSRCSKNNGLNVVVVYGITAPNHGTGQWPNLFGRRNNLFWLIAGIALHPIQYVGEKLSGQTTALHVIARKR